MRLKRNEYLIKTVKYKGKKALRKHEIEKYERKKTDIETADTITA